MSGEFEFLRQLQKNRSFSVIQLFSLQDIDGSDIDMEVNKTVTNKGKATCSHLRSHETGTMSLSCVTRPWSVFNTWPEMEFILVLFYIKQILE